jgi:class 3 adenylate cyclase
MPTSRFDCLGRDGWSRLRDTVSVSAPETLYAKTAAGRVAYQVVGAGPPDVLGIMSAGFIPVDLMWDEPRVVRFLNGLSSFCRHIWFDFRGTGASDWIAPVEGRLTESAVDDMIAVLDERGYERVVVLGGLSMAALLFAAAHPERTSALVLINPYARIRGADDYPYGLSDEEIEAVLAMTRDRWGRGELLGTFSPSVAGDTRFARWFARCERLSAPPEYAYGRLRAVFEIDVRHLLPTIRVPTLVVVRAGWRGYEASRYVAEHIHGARYVELPGEDAFFFASDTGPLLDAIEEFTTGRLPHHELDRVLATVLFTDVVGSTEQAASMGDRRWSELLATHDSVTRAELERFRGREIKTTGDGFLATFDGPGRAVRCACAIRDAVRAIGISVRGGLHTGEIELLGDDIGGIAVHIAQRVQELAQRDEVLVSRTVADLVGGSGMRFAERGIHALKGVPNQWQLFAVEDPQLRPGASGELVANPPTENAPAHRTSPGEYR